jgi:hypothetical protein
MQLLQVAQELGDAELLASVHSLAELGRRTTAQLIGHLVEVERRGLHLVHAFDSLFEYCRRELRFSEGEAYNRSVAVRVARQFPVVLEMHEDGSLTLTAVSVLQKHLSADNHLELLQAAQGKRKLEVQELVARLAPRPDAPTVMRRVEPPPPAPVTSLFAARAVASEVPVPTPAAPRPTVVAPLAPERYRYQTTISARTLGKLREAKQLLRHAVPGGEDDAILERALDVLLQKVMRERFGKASRPGASRARNPHARGVPAAVRRAVVDRDGLQCAFVGPDGRRCGSRASVELQHRKPYMAGGKPTVENIAVYCRAHNQHEARVFFARS